MGWKGTEGGGVVGVVGMMIGESEDQPPCDRCCTEALPLVVRRRQLFSLLNVIVRHTSLMMKWDPSPASLFVLTTCLLWQVCGVESSRVRVFAQWTCRIRVVVGRPADELLMISGWTRGVQVKLWDPLRTRAIPERLSLRCVHDKALYKSTFTFTFTWSHWTRHPPTVQFWSQDRSRWCQVVNDDDDVDDQDGNSISVTVSAPLETGSSRILHRGGGVFRV